MESGSRFRQSQHEEEEEEEEERRILEILF
jgi:hypothetical protein